MYDFATRTAGTNAFAYEGISSVALPSNKTFPSDEHWWFEYTNISAHDGLVNIISTRQNNTYPMLRYVFELDEAEADIDQLDFLWNGKGTNANNGRRDGVILYIWNYSNNSYEQIATSGNTTADVDLTHTITASIADYIDENNNNALTLFVVSNDRANGNQDNKISANYVSVVVDAVTVVREPILEYRFDECSYTGDAGDVIDETGNFNGDSNGISAPINEGIINKSLDLSADNTRDWVDVPRGTVNGLNNFSVSVWFKTSVSKSQQEIFHALGKNTSDDELEIFLKNKKTVYIKVRDDSEELDSDIELTDNRWHHLVLTRADEDVCLFIDGVKQDCDDDVGDGQLSVPFANAIVIGQEQDSFGGDFSKSQNFEGQLDEFKIFDVKLTDTQISSIYQHELAGNNFDGSTRQPDFCSAPEPELEYRFDEASWSGNSGEVDDNSRHELNGHAVGDTTTITAGQICRAGTFDGTGDYINVNRINSYLSSSASLSFWIKSDQYGNNTAWYAPGIMGVEEVGGGDDIFWGYLDASGHIKIQKGNGSSARSNTKISSNSWHHVVLTRDSSTGVVQVFVDGKLEDSANSETGDVSTAFSSIGRIEHSFSSSNFMGELDELLVYNSVISASDVFSIYTNQLNGDNYDGSPRNCPTMSIHHYEIEHDGQGLTCEAETITIKACTNAACSTLSSEEVTLNVTATGSRDSVTDSISFTGTGTANIRYTFPESTLLLLSKQGTNSTVCSDGRSTNCNLVFANAGFRFISGNSTTLPNQTSGTVFGDTLQIQAVKDTNGVCTGLFSGKRNVNLSQENVNPGGTKGLNFSINDQNIAKHPSITSTRLNFGANSIAEIPTPIYHDAGKIRLHANYKVGEGDYSGVTLFGSSNPFWVSPAELVVSARSGGTNLNGATATATLTHKAGEKFDLSVTALNSLGISTPNYSPGKIQLKLTRTGPTLTDSAEGNLSYAASNTLATSTRAVFQDVTMTNFLLGQSTYGDAQYSEVGLLNLDVQDSNYGQASIVITAKDINIGRFIPDHFKQTVVDDGNLFATCGTNPPFAYSGEKDEAISSIGAISYLANPILVITAYNKKGISTKNYDGEFMKLRATDVIVAAPSFDQDARGIDNKILSLTTNDDNNNYMKTGTLTQSSGGVLHYQFSNDDNFYYNRTANALVAPFTSDIDFSIDTIIDSDSVDLIPSDSSLLPTTVVAHPEGVQIRFGRLVLKNSVGPATSNLTQPLQVEHFDGDHFIVSSDNNCLSYDDENIILDDSAPTVALGDDGHFIAGETWAIQLQAPGVKGDIDVEYEAYDWLKYDWNNDGVYNNNPTAVATFGFFRGNDRVIYRRRVYN